MDRLQELKTIFHDDYAASEDVRDMANEAYRFVNVRGGHWEGDWIGDSYENRAKMQLDHVSAFCRRVNSKYLQARPQVNYSPSDEATTAEDAELLDGVLRRDLTRDGGQTSIDTAVWEQTVDGFGAVILNTEYEDEGDPENENQNITFTNQPCAYATVVFDQGATRADKADANRVSVLTPYSKKEHKRLWPDANISSIDPNDRSWFTRNTVAADLVYVCCFYEVKMERVKLHTFSNSNEIDPKTGAPSIVKLYDDQLEGNEEDLTLFGFEKIRTRTIKRRSVFKTTFNGAEILEEEKRIVGKYLPVIPFYGYRAWVDGVEHYRGVVSEVMDAQRVLDMSFSLAAEGAAHASDNKPIFSPQQMQNPMVRQQFAGNWHQRPYLLADDIKDASGNVTHRGPAAILPGTSMSPVASTVMQMATESMQMSMGGAPQETIDPNSSGKAIQAVFDRIDMNTDMIHDNTDQSMMHLGRVYESMASEVYSANPNRNIKVITDRNEAKSVVLNKTVGIAGKITAINDLSKGKFDVVVNVSKDYQTENEETFEALRDMIALIPETDPDRAIYVKWLFMLKEGRGFRDMKKRIRNELILKGWMEADTDEEKRMLAQAQQASANQPKDPNAALMEAAAAEQETQAALNQAKIADTQASAVKKAAEAEKIKVDSRLLVKELRQPQQQNLNL